MTSWNSKLEARGWRIKDGTWWRTFRADCAAATTNCGLEPAALLEQLKFDWFVQFAALGTAGTVDVRVVGVNVAAIFAAEDPVLRTSRTEAVPAHFRINSKTAQGAQQSRHVNHYKY